MLQRSIHPLFIRNFPFTCTTCRILQQLHTSSQFLTHKSTYTTAYNNSNNNNLQLTPKRFSISSRKFYDLTRAKVLFDNLDKTGNMVLNLYQYVLDLPRWHFMAMLFSGYLFYYFIEVVKRPILAVKEGPYKQFLLTHVPILEMKFWPTFWCVEPRAQTVFASILRATVFPKMSYRRELFTMKDGGEVALDWLDTKCASDSPVIIILPGLTGESQAEYIKCLVMSANRIGIRVVVFNQRGLGGVSLKTPRLYCAANCEDLCEVVEHVHKLHPHVNIGATGISMGGLILGNYLAKHAEEAAKYLTAAKIISAPWNVFKGSDSIEKPFLNNMLGRHLADSLCKTVDQYDILKSKEFNWDMTKVMQSKTIKEFDSQFTAKHFGFKDVDHYYTEATMHDKLHSIKVPVLCLSAADDPFQPLEALPLQDAETSSHVCFVVTARGGHIGFLEGWWPMSSDQYMNRLFCQFFSSTLFHQVTEFEKVTGQLKNVQLCD